jgi:hypothetical protein
LNPAKAGGSSADARSTSLRSCSEYRRTRTLKASNSGARHGCILDGPAMVREDANIDHLHIGHEELADAAE